MSKAMEEIVNEKLEEKMEASARRMIRDGVLSDDKIAEYSGLTVAQVKKLKEEEFVAV